MSTTCNVNDLFFFCLHSPDEVSAGVIVQNVNVKMEVEVEPLVIRASGLMVLESVGQSLVQL